MIDDTREAFVLPNNGCRISVLSSSGWLDKVSFEKSQLFIDTGSESQMVVLWEERNGFPVVKNLKGTIDVTHSSGRYFLNISTKGQQSFLIRGK